MQGPSKYAHTYTVEAVQPSRDSSGDMLEGWAATGATVTGVISTLTADEMAQYGQMEHDVTHSLVTWDPPYTGAKPGDRLVLDGAYFYIRLITNPAMRGRLTVYRLEKDPGGA